MIAYSNQQALRFIRVPIGPISPTHLWIVQKSLLDYNEHRGFIKVFHLLYLAT